nr:protein arginine N-methyltransferase [Tanacetum cinerariifolium]
MMASGGSFITSFEDIKSFLAMHTPPNDLIRTYSKKANEVVKANNLSDKVIVLHGRVEDVQIDEEVDVIISEWMGYMLLYESMLGSVIVARDRWLKPGGLILPSNAVLYMAPVTHPDRYAESIDFWRNVYGIDMSPILPLAKQCAFEEPCVELISGESVLTWPNVVCTDNHTSNSISKDKKSVVPVTNGDKLSWDRMNSGKRYSKSQDLQTMNDQ